MRTHGMSPSEIEEVTNAHRHKSVRERVEDSVMFLIPPAAFVATQLLGGQ